MTKFVYRLAGVTIAALAAISPAQAAPAVDCDLVLQEFGGGRINGYDALTGGDYTDPIRLGLRNRGIGICTGVLVITRTASFDRLDGPEANALDYLVVDAANLAQVLLEPLSQQTQGLPFTVGAKSTIDIYPRLLVRGGQSGRQGRYFATLQARANLGPNQNAVEREFNVSAQVVSRVQANFSGGRNATLDLGELAPNVTGSINMQIRSSADIDVVVSSENEGNLKHSQGNQRIPYSLTFDNRPVDLANGSAFNIELQNSVRGQSMPVVVTVGQFSQAPVGVYGDVVTFRITAR